MKNAAIVVGWILSLAGLVWAAAASSATTRADVQRIDSKASDHESRLRVIERHLEQIGADTAWIRSTLQRHLDRDEPIGGPE